MMDTDNEIRRKLQSKFRDYRAPVPADGWDRIEQSLNAARAARMTVRRRWYAASAAAAVILVVAILLMRPTADEPVMVPESDPSLSLVEPPHGQSEAPQEQRESPQEQIEPSQGSHPNVDEPGNSGHKMTGSSAGTLYATGQVNRQGGFPAAFGKGDKLDLGLQQRQTVSVKAERNVKEPDLHLVVKEVALHSTASAANDAGEEEFVITGGEREGLITEQERGNVSARQLMLALNGRGGLTPFQKTVNSPLTLRSVEYAEAGPSAVRPSKMILAASSTADNVAEMEHNQPVSFGITLSRSLSDDLSLETGLVYTYLSSEVKNTSPNLQVRETQQLHYVGIPLNVNYNLFSVKKLNLYVSMGGMVEKDVYGEYRRTGEGSSPELNVSSEEEEITRISQRNPQISVNAGVGISYPVYQNLKLYGKIGGAYYFDANNEYKTIYSDSKIVMDLNVGLRFEFK